MAKTVISSDQAPKAIGPYSQAVRAGDFVFLSGQIPLDPATGEMVAGDIAAQTRRVMENLKAVLEAAGAGFAHVVRTTIFLADLGDFQAVNAVYGEYFRGEPPARATVQVAALPRGARVEIDAVAYLGALGRPSQTNPPPAHEPGGARARSSGPEWRSMAKKNASQASTSFSAELLKATAASAIEAVNTVGADEQADLVEAWVAAGNVEAVARVAGEDEAPAPARKAARRGLNVLKSRGIRVPEKSTVAKPFAGAAERTLEARFLPTDGSGQAVLTILARTAGKDTHLCDVVYADGPGILRVSGGWLSNHKLREWENDSKRVRGFAHVEVPVAWARWRISELRKQNASSGYLLPLELDQFAELLSPVPEAAPPHPATQLEAGEIANADVRVAQSASLHLEPEFRSFLVSRQAIGEVLTNVGAKLAQAGNAEPTQEALDPILAEELKAAVDRFFEPEVRKQLAERMLDAAVSIAKRMGKERALDVLATRQAVLNAGLITQPPREIPFLRAFYEKTLAILASQQNGQLSIPMPARPQPQGPVLSAEQLAAIQAAKEQQPEQP